MPALFRNLVFVFAFLAASAIYAADPDINVQEIPIGDMTVLGIFDASGQTPEDLIPNLGKYPEFADLFKRGPLASVSKTYLFKNGDRLVLVDGGWGDELGVKGKTGEILKNRGIKPDAITDILLTHLDWDHIGGLTKNGKAVYPDATIWIAKPEYEAWMNDELKGRPEFGKQRAKALAEIYRDKIRLFNFGDEILPGVKALDASGHTPGHTAYEINSGKDRLTVAGDLVHMYQVQFIRPELSSKYDNDPDRAAKAREALLAKVCAEKGEFAGMHFPMASDVQKRQDHGYMMMEPR